MIKSALSQPEILRIGDSAFPEIYEVLFGCSVNRFQLSAGCFLRLVYNLSFKLVSLNMVTDLHFLIFTPEVNEFSCFFFLN